jgi:RNA polymerase sigma-70 factor (ECF subfamily)
MAMGGARGTDEAWDLLYRANAQPLYRYLLRLTLGDHDQAEDHLQETFLRAWRWLQDHPLDPTTIRPWLFTVARRIVIDAARSRQVRPTEVILDDASTLAGTDNDIERFVQAHVVRGALRTLSPKHRAALVELFYHERTAQEAADILGIPEGTVKSRAHYALRALRAAALVADIPSERRPVWAIDTTRPAGAGRPVGVPGRHPRSAARAEGTPPGRRGPRGQGLSR